MSAGGGDEAGAETRVDTATGAAFGLDGRADVKVRRCALTGLEGPFTGGRFESSTHSVSIGSHPSNDLVIEDETVSRFHCELVLDETGARARDQQSRNGTVVDGVRVVECWLRDGSTLKLGQTVLRIEVSSEQCLLPVSEETRFGSLVGRSGVMRATFAILERAAATDATVLLQGDTGTGKEGAAAGLHETGPRRARPFVIVDLSAIPAQLLESELFGHLKGSFTGAVRDRVGAFEEADGGTLFLDEVGEVPTDLQPKLLRVLEQRTVRRVGENVRHSVDVRVIAATNRDLRVEVNEGRFRSDLYYRLAVVKVPMPPLCERPEDIPLLVESILHTLGADASIVAELLSDDVVGRMARYAWPGNVRELRNYIERCLVFRDAAPPLDASRARPAPEHQADTSLPWTQARKRCLGRFEREYVEALLRAHDGDVSQAAQAAGVDRAYVYRIMRRHGIRG